MMIDESAERACKTTTHLRLYEEYVKTVRMRNNCESGGGGYVRYRQHEEK